MKFLLVMLAMFPVTAQAFTQYYEYGDWRVTIDSIKTGEDFRVLCTATTGGNGQPSLRISVSNGDVLPPDFYPAPVLHEYAPRGHATMMQDGQRVLFEFDPDTVAEGFVQAFQDEDGIMQAQAFTHTDDNLWLLQNMRQRDRLWITRDDDVIARVSLTGFTASYGEIAAQCGFSTVGVIE